MQFSFFFLSSNHNGRFLMAPSRDDNGKCHLQRGGRSGGHSGRTFKQDAEFPTLRATYFLKNACMLPRACEDAAAVTRAATGGKCFAAHLAANIFCRQLGQHALREKSTLKGSSLGRVWPRCNL